MSKPKGPPKDWTPRAYFLRFVRSDHKGRNICVYDGQTEPSRWTGREVKKETWVPVKHIEGRDSLWARSLGPRTDIAIVIPAWVAEELGLINANDLQRAEAYERGSRVLL
jgi:hypothetical protein